MAVVGYCVKCKAKKEMVNPQEGVTKNNASSPRGTCPDCGTKMSLIGGLKKLTRTHFHIFFKGGFGRLFLCRFSFGYSFAAESSALAGDEKG